MQDVHKSKVGTGSKPRAPNENCHLLPLGEEAVHDLDVEWSRY